MGDSDSENEPEYLQYKIVVLGDGTVGKTSLIQRFCEDNFAKSYKQTIGVDFFAKRIELPQNTLVGLQVWDIGGQSIFGKMIGTYIYESNAVLLVYDITNHESFLNLQDWLQLVQKTFEGKTLPLIALIGNKTDLFHMQAVDLDRHNEFAEENQLYSYFVSAKTGDQVNLTFYKVAAALAGVEVKKPLVEVAQKIVKAEIVNHQQNEETEPKAEEKLEKRAKKKGGCIIF